MEQEESHQIAQIFQFLPVKTLLRCRCLSTWHKSSIDNPNFSVLYGFFSAACLTRSRRLFLQFYRPTAAAAPIGFCPFSHQEAPGQIFPGRSSVVARSCFGVLCVASSPFDLCLWNPATWTHRHIIQPTYERHDAVDLAAFRRVSFGVGYDGNKNSKLVRLVFSFSPETRAFIGEASVYTVHSDTWQTIDCQLTWTANSYEVRWQSLWEFGKSGVCVKHKIKWAFKLSGSTQNGAGQFTIVSLNLNNYRFDTKPVPEFMIDGRNPDDLIDIDLWPFNFAVCVSVYFGGESPGVAIWVQDFQIWSTLLTVKGSFQRLKPLFYSLNKKKVLLQMDSRLVWYDLLTEKYWDSDGLPDGSVLYDATAYVESCDLINGAGRCLSS